MKRRINVHLLRFAATRTAACVLGCVWIILAAPAQPVVSDAVQDKFVPVMPEEAQYASYLGQRMKLNAVDRLVDHIAKYGLINEFLKGFENRPGAQDWCGEYLGKHLHSSTLAWAYSKSPELKANIDDMAQRLIASQTPAGYLGTYVESNYWSSWDVWTQKYALMGLMAYYQFTGDETALNACKKEGDLLISVFGPGKRDLNGVGMYWGMPSTSVLEPICDLYRYAGDQKYLDFARYIVSQIDSSGPQLISKLLDGIGVNMIPDGDPNNFNAKSYEMLSNLVGVADFYRLTGTQRYLDACLNAWDDIYTKRHYIIGSSSYLERFKADYSLAGEGVEQWHSGPCEACVTVAWLQLTWHLYRLTGEIKYADEIERIVYNALIGAQRPVKGFNSLLNAECIGDVVYGSVLTGVKWYGLVNHYVYDISCCAASLPRGIAMISQMMQGASGNIPTVNLYTPAVTRMPITAQGEDITVGIEVATEYPSDGKIYITVNPPKAATFTLRLRIPQWCTYSWASAHGTTVTGTQGEFLDIDGEWQPGDKVFLYLYMDYHLIPGGPGQPVGLEYPGKVGVQRGPQILATDANVSTALPGNWVGGLMYAVPVAGSSAPKVMVPYSDAGQQLETFSVYQDGFEIDASKLDPKDPAAVSNRRSMPIAGTSKQSAFEFNRTSGLIHVDAHGPYELTVIAPNGASMQTFCGNTAGSHSIREMRGGVYLVIIKTSEQRQTKSIVFAK